jgi:RimJ/RimL family protein N-acetyltransferase
MSAGVDTLAASVPVLKTERLILRAPRLSDLDSITGFVTSDRAAFVGGPGKPWDGWTSLTSLIGHWVIRGFGWWMMEDRETGATVGRTGIGFHADWPEPELGWHIYQGFEGRGLAHEGALAARAHAHRVMGLGPVISLIAPANTRSRRLAERMGATVERETVVRETSCLVYRHPAEVPA